MGGEAIQVAVRIRPFLPFEAGSKSCIDVLPGEDDQNSSTSTTKISQGKSVHIGYHRHHNRDNSSSNNNGRQSLDNGHTFTFDKCFSGLANQVTIYKSLIVPLLENCLEGYNATALAYGQTGAGKTYTTLGPATSPDFFAPQNKDKHTQEYDAVGMLPRALRDIFNKLDEKCHTLNSNNGAENDSEKSNGRATGEISSSSTDGIPVATKSPPPKSRSNGNLNGNSGSQPFEYTVKLQFLELYGEEVRDLLATNSSKQQKIIIRDSAGDSEALGASTIPVNTASEAMVCLTRGMLRRVTGATAMNAESSRSHAIMSVIIEQSTRSISEMEGEAVINQKSKFNFVDLAGCERAKRTNAKGTRMKEGININKGLLVLGNVISALASGDPKKFIPFRDSKLTRLLRGSLGGNHKTLMIACASPSHKNAEESLNCLRYANRAKNIQNKATINVDPHSKLVNMLKGQVTALAGELLRLSNRGGGKVDNERFTLDLLEVLIKGGKDAQSITIGNKDKTTTSANGEATSNTKATSSELTAELEKTKLALKESQKQLADKSEELDSLRRVSEASTTTAVVASTPSRSTYSVATPSKAIGMGRDESIQDILTTLSTAEDEGSDVVGTLSPDANSGEELQSQQVQELSSKLETLTEVLNEKSEMLDVALEENETLRERLRDTPDIDEETIHCIINNVASYAGQRMDDEGDVLSVSSSTSSSEEEEEDEGKREKNEELSTFASAMFSTGKFLVDRELFEDSIVCFETVLEVRRELYGWDDPLVGDALHMEGFVRSKMGDYDRALMLLWDALRIRKITSEPLKISATLRLLADLHFSKEENMHAALFYEECSFQLKEYDMNDPHLPLVLIDLARTKDRLGEYSESMNFFEEALSLYERSLDHDDDRIASLQYEMGVLAFQMGERDRGEECFRHFIRIRKSKGSSMDEGVANALFVLGSLHWATKKRDLAQDCWHEALEIFKALGRNDEDPYVKSLKEKIHKAQRRPITRMFRGS